jgi:hypothetical protein
MEKQSKAALTICAESQKVSDSRRSDLISAWIFKFSLACQARGKEHAVSESTAPMLAQVWAEGLSDVPTDALEPAFRETLKTCKWFPTVADIREHIERAKESGLEDEWLAVMEAVSRWYYPDLGWRGPRLPADVDHAARAAGGYAYLESCSEHDLVFAKQRFLEDLARQRKSGSVSQFLPPSPMLRLLKPTAARLSLPASKPLPQTGHSEAFNQQTLKDSVRTAQAQELIAQGERLWKEVKGASL